MDYVPVYADEAEAASSGIVKISPGRVQQIGVKSEPVSRRDLVRPIRAVGTVQFDERRTFVVSTRFEGWIEKLLVNATGETVRRGQPLMQVYSPDLVLAQQEYALLRTVRTRGRQRRRRKRRYAPAARGRRAAASLSRLSRVGDGATEAGSGAAVDRDDPVAGERHGDREAGAPGHAVHAGRAALQDRRHVDGLADRRGVRAGPGRRRASARRRRSR